MDDADLMRHTLPWRTGERLADHPYAIIRDASRCVMMCHDMPDGRFRVRAASERRRREEGGEKEAEARSLRSVCPDVLTWWCDTCDTHMVAHDHMTLSWLTSPTAMSSGTTKLSL